MFNQQHQMIDSFTNMRARGLITFHCQFCRQQTPSLRWDLDDWRYLSGIHPKKRRLL